MKMAALLVLLCVLQGCQASEPTVEVEPLEVQAARVHRAAIVLDTHSDTTPNFETDWDFGVRHADGHMDLPRIREGGLDAIFFSIWMGETPGEGRAIKTALDRIDGLYRALDRWSDDMVLATTVAEIRAAADDGKVAALMGLEGGHIIEDDLAALRTFHRLGARYMTLTHSFNTNWADSAGTALPPEPEHGGLTDFGRDVVLEMNRLGMMVDISHVSDDTFWDVLEVTRAPVIASHSSCRALADHPRNMSDEMLVALAENGGVIQINFYPGYIDPAQVAMAARLMPEVREIHAKHADDPEAAREARIALFEFHDPGPTPASVVIDHIEHVIELVGGEHVGLGADWDGVPSLPVGLEDCSKLGWVTEELLRRGHSEETVSGVLGGNLLRVMEAVEAVSARS